MAGGMVAPGVTTDEIDRAVHRMVVEAGAYPSPLNYGRFPKSVCTSVNECICHGIPDSRKLRDGDIINIDVTVYLDVRRARWRRRRRRQCCAHCLAARDGPLSIALPPAALLPARATTATPHACSTSAACRPQPRSCARRPSRR